MAKLKDLLNESCMVTRRVQLAQVEVILGKIAPQLSEAEQKKVAEIYVELKTLADTFNTTPYTIKNANHWALLEMILKGKIAEFKLIAEDVAEENKEVDCWPLVKALDNILI